MDGVLYSCQRRNLLKFMRKFEVCNFCWSFKGSVSVLDVGMFSSKCNGKVHLLWEKKILHDSWEHTELSPLKYKLSWHVITKLDLFNSLFSHNSPVVIFVNYTSYASGSKECPYLYHFLKLLSSSEHWLWMKYSKNKFGKNYPPFPTHLGCVAFIMTCFTSTGVGWRL